MVKERITISYDIKDNKPNVKDYIKKLSSCPGEYTGRKDADIGGLILQKFIVSEFNRLNKKENNKAGKDF